jgi:hypothetical protein
VACLLLRGRVYRWDIATASAIGQFMGSKFRVNRPQAAWLRFPPTIDGILGRLHVFPGHHEQPVAPLGRVCLACQLKTVLSERVRLYSRPGNDLIYRFPLIV